MNFSRKSREKCEILDLSTFVFLIILLERKMICEQFRFSMIIDGNTFEWDIHV